MTLLRRSLVALFTLLLGSIPALAQVSYAGGTYTQNFDSLTSLTIVTAANLGSTGPIALTGSPMNGSGLAGWSLARVTGSTANALFASGTGSSATGAVYSFGASSNPERALGILQSGATNPTVGVVFTNNTGTTITQFTVTYTGEQWRYGGTTGTDRLAFEYQVGGSSILGGTYSPVTALDFVSLVNGTTGGTTGAQNGNIIKTTLTSTVTGLTWTAGQNLVLRWTDFNVTGSDDGLAIDDFSFSTSSAPPAASPPTVTSTTPADNAINVSPASSVSITFNAAATVTGTWFTINGSTSGSHTATVMGGPTTYTLVPAPAFAEGETVTVNVIGAQVTDAVTGTAPMAADYPFDFATLSFAPLPIHTIQGSGNVSAYAGQAVAVEGIVTADFQATPGLGGYYIQGAEADYDSDPATSEGMFVFNTSFPVSVGQKVRVAGTVTEFGTAPKTQTELITVTSVIILGVDNTLPTPVTLTLPFPNLDLERYEGMRVNFPQALTVTDTYVDGNYHARFGELLLSNGRLNTPTNMVAPGAPAAALAAANLLNQILIDDGVSTTFPDPTPYMADSGGLGLTRRTGSTTTALTGIFDQRFNFWIVEPTHIAFADTNPRTAPATVGGTLKVAIGNVLNYFNGNGSGGGFPTSRGADTLAEFNRQRAKIIAGITALAPDIMGLTEIENDGYGSTSAIDDLVDGLNAAAPSGTTYAFVDASGVNIITDEIQCTFIYRVQTVAPVGAPAMLDHPSFTGVNIGIARNPLAQTFQQLSNGEKLTISINHFKSKGSASNDPGATNGISPNPNIDQGDGQGASNYVRTLQANALAAWLATDPTGSGDPDFLIIGDLNAYAKEDPIVALENAGYINLTEAAEGVGGYSYAFDGAFGHLDHALANNHLAAQVVDARTWHVNSDEPAFYDYNISITNPNYTKTAGQQAINVGTAYRYSDHDPVVVGLNLYTDVTPPVISTLKATPAVLGFGASVLVPVTLTVTASDNVDPAPVSTIHSVTSTVPLVAGVDYQLTGPLTLKLLRKVAGPRNYIITVKCTDASGNSAFKSVKVSSGPVPIL